MATRLDLQAALQSFIGVREDGKPNVYFQPPESLKLNYPCIVYSRDRLVLNSADNLNYLASQGYQVTILTKDPDDELINNLPKTFPMCRYSRHYTANNLNHEVFYLFY